MAEVTPRSLRAVLAPLQRRIAMLAARAVVRLVDDRAQRQRLQLEILQGELRDDIERVQDYGFTSHPLTGSDAIVLCAGGVREQAIAVVVDDRRYRVRLQPGEVAVYDDLGNSVQLLRDRILVHALDTLEVIAPQATVVADAITLSAMTLAIEADVTIKGDTRFAGSVTANGKRIDETHTHGGVQRGTDSTGMPL